jgi:hypothetical protein
VVARSVDRATCRKALLATEGRDFTDARFDENWQGGPRKRDRIGALSLLHPVHVRRQSGQALPRVACTRPLSSKDGSGGDRPPHPLSRTNLSGSWSCSAEFACRSRPIGRARSISQQVPEHVTELVRGELQRGVAHLELDALEVGRARRHGVRKRPYPFALGHRERGRA